MKKNIRWAYEAQKKGAKRRGIDFRLSFRQWLQIWVKSGHLHERGVTRNSYCMGRFGDTGAYEIGNVKIITVAQNVREATARTMSWGKRKSV